jgi:hypothetical protein
MRRQSGQGIQEHRDPFLREEPSSKSEQEAIPWPRPDRGGWDAVRHDGVDGDPVPLEDLGH